MFRREGLGGVGRDTRERWRAQETECEREKGGGAGDAGLRLFLHAATALSCLQPWGAGYMFCCVAFLKYPDRELPVVMAVLLTDCLTC